MNGIKNPLFITENGMPNVDFVCLDGKVHDPQRIDFIERYLLALEKAKKRALTFAVIFIGVCWIILNGATATIRGSGLFT